LNWKKPSGTANQFAGEERSRLFINKIIIISSHVKKNSPTQRKQHRASQPPLYCMKEGKKKERKQKHASYYSQTNHPIE